MGPGWGRHPPRQPGTHRTGLLMSNLITRRRPSTSEPSRIPERGNRKWGYWLYFAPGAILIGVVIFYPIIRNLRLSFFHWRGGRAEEQFAGFENWTRLFQDSEYIQSFMNIALVIVAMVIVPTLLGLVVAAALFDVVGRRFGGKLSSFLRATYYLPQILPVAIAGIVIGWILRPQNGALNEILTAIGLGDLAHNWLGSPDTALASIMVVLVWVQLGYPVVIFMAALQRVDPELYEAAELDGAGWFTRFRAITLAQIRPEVFVVTLTCTIAALKVFGPIYVLTRGGPGNATLVPSYYAYSEFFQ